MTSTGEWRAALAAGAIAPASLTEAGFAHLSTPEQVVLPADRLFHGRSDLVLLVLDPDRIGVPVRYEPGVPTDPASMLFPHAYGPIPPGAVLAVLPYRPRPDGGFDAPTVPPLDPGGRHAVLGRSLLRRAATREEPVTGGVAVLTDTVPTSWSHNQLLIDAPVAPEQLAADAERVLGGAGLAHRHAHLTGAHLAGTAADLASAGWLVTEIVGMAAPAGGEPVARVERIGVDALRAEPGISGSRAIIDRYAVENAVADVRHLAVREDGAVVAWAALTIDGGTARLDAVSTEPDFRGRGHGDALLRTSMAVAAEAGCDLVVLDANADDRTLRRYAGRGFEEGARSWSAHRAP
jgi:uncharacterized protein (DUF952 family)/ribosomal protein S18 acetylase RimI-like enzyme